MVGPIHRVGGGERYGRGARPVSSRGLKGSSRADMQVGESAIPSQPPRLTTNGSYPWKIRSLPCREITTFYARISELGARQGGWVRRLRRTAASVVEMLQPSAYIALHRRSIVAFGSRYYVMLSLLMGVPCSGGRRLWGSIGTWAKLVSAGPRGNQSQSPTGGLIFMISL